MGKAMLFIGWIILFGILTFVFGSWEENQYNPNSNIEGSDSGQTIEIVLERNRFSHYVATGQVNDEDVIFMLDTGATVVSVPAGLARKLNLKKGAKGKVRTANGIADSWQTNIAKLELGPITLYNVHASINPGMQGEEILLGMSALKHLEFTQRGDTLTIKQYR